MPEEKVALEVNGDQHDQQGTRNLEEESYHKVDIWGLVRVNGLKIVETVGSTVQTRFGVQVCQAVDGVNVLGLLLITQLSPGECVSILINRD